MKKQNPKTVMGLILGVILLAAVGVLIARIIPTAQEVRREMSLTPTPLPPKADSVMAVTPDPSAPTPAPVLRSGSQGEAVIQLQSRLKALGYYTGEIDGQFGAGTREAVTAFQKNNGLEADGQAGAETGMVLFSAEARPAGIGETQEKNP